MKKLVISNRKALELKYGKAGADKIAALLDRLIQADAARGIRTIVSYLDAAALGSLRVRKADNERAVKNAVDHLHALNGKPDYLLLLGAPDVVPHQTLENCVKDGDEDIPSDLPYACEAPHSTDPSTFTGPSRAVGRLADTMGGGTEELEAFLSLIGTAIDWRPSPRRDFEAWFGLTAKVWKGSTSQSLKSLFGSAKGMNTSPLKGPRWKAKELSPRLHFINCHGAPFEPAFYGQEGQSYPEAIRSDQLSGVTRGAVVAAECCFGAQLYDPEGAATGTCSSYLQLGAYGFVGSTTTAYGPEDTNGSADYVCQFFLADVLAGGALGSALLRARQRFVKQEKAVDPVDLKTLAQFILLGDPSIRPVGVEAPPKTMKFTEQVERHRVRSVATRKTAKELSAGVDVAEATPLSPPADMRKRLEVIASENGMKAPGISTNPVRGASSSTLRTRLFGKGMARPTAFHVIVEDDNVAVPVPKGSKSLGKRKAKPEAAEPRIQRKRILVVKQQGPALSVVRMVVSR